MTARSVLVPFTDLGDWKHRALKQHAEATT